MDTPFLDKAKEQRPDLYKLVYPKAYQYVPSNYQSPKKFADSLIAFMLDLLQREKTEEIESTLDCIRQFLHYGEKYKLPSFFVDRQFYRAMWNTDVKDNIDYETLKLPFPAQLLYLPQDIEKEYLLFDRDVDNEPVSIVGLCTYTTTTNRKQFIFFQCSRNYFRLIAKEANTVSEYLQQYSANKSFNMAINILLARLARPSLYSEGTTVRTRGKKTFKELWTPNFIGKGYKTKEEGISTGTHASPRVHWRRGHFRNQHFGIKNAEQKIIWIEPTLVGVEEINEESQIN